MSFLGDKNVTNAGADLCLTAPLGVSGGESVAVGVMQPKDDAAAAAGWWVGLEMNGDGGSALALMLRGRHRNGGGAMACVGIHKQLGYYGVVNDHIYIKLGNLQDSRLSTGNKMWHRDISNQGIRAQTA
jgi:hypothetical protein